MSEKKPPYFSCPNCNTPKCGLTVTLNTSWHSPPFDSIVFPVPRMVNVSKSSLRKQTSEGEKNRSLCIVSDYILIIFNYIGYLSCFSAAKPVLPDFHLFNQNQAGSATIKSNKQNSNKTLKYPGSPCKTLNHPGSPCKSLFVSHFHYRCWPC